jgi:sugar phosphate isomerase/epimerase
MFLNELQLPFDDALATAREIGAEYVWFSSIGEGPEIADMSDRQVDEMAERVGEHDLKQLLISASSPFKQIHLTDIDPDTPTANDDYQAQLGELVRSMEIARRLDVGAVLAYSFAWPGEYSADKPTWPMRWATRGGIIADVDMDRLAAAFAPAIEQAEAHDVDIVLSMMPWNYTNTSGNLRRVVERLNSRRIKVMWGPADTMNCGETDAATAGFTNVRPYLHSLHLKDLHVNDGQALDFEYCPIGQGDVDFPTVLGNVGEHRPDAVLSVATHFRPSSGSPTEAMHINYANLRALIDQVEASGQESAA